MSRTTINIDSPLIVAIRDLARKEGKSMGKLVSELIAIGLETKRNKDRRLVRRLKWNTQPMGARIDYSDKDRLYAVLDESE